MSFGGKGNLFVDLFDSNDPGDKSDKYNSRYNGVPFNYSTFLQDSK